jgi:peptidoglycan-N-acetylglucosamine deacetylase
MITSRRLTASFLCFTCLFCSAQQRRPRQPQEVSQPGTLWSDEKIRETVAAVSMGPKLLPGSWPNHARVAVLITFDDDTQAPLLRDGTTEPTALSASDYGAQTGTPRLLEILDRHKIPATFFVTGVDSLIHPELVPSILKSGRNEIGIHGWIHEYPPGLDGEDEEERLLDRAIARISSLTGKRPVGYRAPSWAFSSYTMDLIRKKGFLYDSSLQASGCLTRFLPRGKIPASSSFQSTGLSPKPSTWALRDTCHHQIFSFSFTNKSSTELIRKEQPSS